MFQQTNQTNFKIPLSGCLESHLSNSVSCIANCPSSFPIASKCFTSSLLPNLQAKTREFSTVPASSPVGVCDMPTTLYSSYLKHLKPQQRNK